MAETNAQRYERMRINNPPVEYGEKQCSRCGVVRPMAEFMPHPLGAFGRQASCRDCELDRMARRRHGLTAAERAAIAEEQSGCAICRRTEPGGKGWVVDHDRACCAGDASCPKCRRGIVCQWCNSALGYAFDDPEVLRRMADYIESGVRLSDRYTDRSTDRTDMTDGLTKKVVTPQPNRSGSRRGRAGAKAGCRRWSR